MKIIIIVYTVAMMQGFLDAYVPQSQCVPEIKESFDNLGLDFDYIQNARQHVEESINSIKSHISQVQLNIENSAAKGTDCVKQLSERLEEINTSYLAELAAYAETVENNDIGRRLDKCLHSLAYCFEKAPSCSDTKSCIEECEEILYGDDILNDSKIDAYLKGVESGLTKESEKIINKVNEINVSIPSC